MEQVNCGCQARCRTHTEGPCGQIARLNGWPSAEERAKEGNPGTPLCVACGGESTGRGWFLRARPETRLGK